MKLTPAARSCRRRQQPPATYAIYSFHFSSFCRSSVAAVFFSHVAAFTLHASAAARLIFADLQLSFLRHFSLPPPFRRRRLPAAADAPRFQLCRQRTLPPHFAASISPLPPPRCAPRCRMIAVLFLLSITPLFRRCAAALRRMPAVSHAVFAACRHALPCFAAAPIFADALLSGFSP